jgi:hypothetical protein
MACSGRRVIGRIKMPNDCDANGATKRTTKMPFFRTYCERANQGRKRRVLTFACQVLGLYLSIEVKDESRMATTGHSGGSTRSVLRTMVVGVVEGEKGKSEPGLLGDYTLQ